MATSEPAMARDSAETGRFRPLFLLALCVALPMVLFDTIDGVNFLGDIDDQLRAVQIRLLVEGGSWFDRTIPMIQMPEAYVSPWSRLVDLPYAVLAWMSGPVLGTDNALQVAFRVVPPILLVGFCALLVKTMLAMFDGIVPVKSVSLIASLMLMWLALWEFSPGRIDHHNVQLLLIMLSFWGLSLWTPRGAVLAGIGCVGSVAVGLELLPLISVILGGVSLAWMLDRPGSRAFALALGLTMLVATPLFGLGLIGPSELVSTQCDALSAPFAVALAGYGGIMAVLAGMPVRAGWIGRGALLAVAGAALVAWLAWQYPLCLQGPYHMIDPLSRTFWLERVEQEKSFLLYFQNGNSATLVVLGILAVVLAMAAPMVLATLRMGRSALAIIYACAVVALVLTLLQTRYVRFPIALATLFVPYFLSMVSQRGQATSKLLAGAVAAVAATGLALQALVPARSEQFDVVDYLAYPHCEQADASVLERVEPGRIMAPPWMGLQLMEQLPPGMTVASVSFHRAAPGMRRTLQGFASTDGATRRTALEDSDYIALCRLPVPDSVGTDTLFAVVARGGDWPGLTRISGPDDTFMLYQIDHAALR
jgi:hypothetical protein